ncbi:MAG: carboxylating nicotinate-nucleotide diphosphorylase [Candidatus Aminicenantes bacterium]|nr:carboxylating nicotinate-nucleotide diphosphorylase [Candidatus Aminicenantes bacterium]MDH5706133.1 carboxylating nicotinate-nucleotide diphosphorylase [Candidatus Aminicenantes bacterium]
MQNKEFDAIIDLALEEDTGHGDVTSQALLPEELRGEAYMTAKAGGVLAGSEIARSVFLKVDPSLKVNLLIRDGSELKPGDILATISGRLTGILKGERVALNFLQHLSGVATETARYIAATKGCKARIVDTRKTTPGMRAMEKYAVRMGGGQNHRMHMGDAVLIKDTHLAALRGLGLTLTQIIEKARKNAPPGMTIEMEVDTAADAVEAATAGADIIMLDNMDAATMACVVQSLPGQAKTEASGGITLENVRAAAESGVDIVSIGALTHSTTALDISLEVRAESLETP